MKYSTMLLGIVLTSFKVFIQTIIYVVTRPIVYWAKKRSSCTEPLHNHHDGCPVCDMDSIISRKFIVPLTTFYRLCSECDTYKTKDQWGDHSDYCEECYLDMW